ncbi:DUF6908 domain-containing protein [Cellvibrio sp. ARAG 10.3]|uniref:DUF6908 domain-containing protein n=1 Tax=Cellvibrio sp. ARAG 10.3 TaxID=3451358 RepID=UPI003F48865E
MNNSIYQRNFNQLIALNICDEQGSLRPCGKSRSQGYMDLVYERLPMIDCVNGLPNKAISIAHYFEMNGDLCQDPEMVVLVNASSKTAEAYHFQQAMPPIYQEVYDDGNRVDPALKQNLNTFLETWLANLVNQGHGVEWEDYQE